MLRCNDHSLQTPQLLVYQLNSAPTSPPEVCAYFLNGRIVTDVNMQNVPPLSLLPNFSAIYR